MQLLRTLVIRLGLLTIATLFGSFSSSAQDSKPVHLLALLSLSGSAAEQGEWVRRGLELGALEPSSESAAAVNITYDDTSGDPKNALAAYKRQRESNTFPVVFTYGSGVGVALTPLVNGDKVIQFGLATSTPAYSTPEDYTFRNFPDSRLECMFSAQSIISKLKAKNIAIVEIENEFGSGNARAFKAAFESLGGNVIAHETIASNATDFRSVILRIKQKNPEAIYLAVYPTEGALFLRQAKELGLNVPKLAATAILGSQGFFDLAHDAAEGLLITNSTPIYSDSKNPAVVKFVKAYQARYHEAPGPQHIYAVRAYDVIKLIRAALASCASDDSTCLRDYLFKVHNYPGASGTISFDRNGDVSTDFDLVQVRGGHLQAALD